MKPVPFKNCIIISLTALIFLGCQRGPKNWELDQVQTGTELHNSAKLSSTTSSELALQIVRTDAGISVYLISTSRPFSFPNSTGEYCAVKACFGQTVTEIFEAKRHAGSYKVKLPDNEATKVVKALLTNTAVTLEVASSRLLLNPEGFKRLYKQMLKFSLFDLPVSIGV